MASPASYQAIPPTSVAGQQPVHDNPSLRPFPTTRRTLSLSLALVATFVAFAVSTAYVTRINSKAHVAASLPFESDRAWQSIAFPARSAQHILVGRQADVIVDERVATGDCTKGRKCRARIVITSEAGRVTVQAGYLVMSRSGKPRSLNRRTKKHISKVTYAEAMKWATQLLAAVSPQLKAVGSQVTVEQIAKGIMDTKDSVLSCPRTDNPLCSVLETVEEILPTPTPSPRPKPRAVPVVPVACGGPPNEACESLFLSPVTPASPAPTGLSQLQSVTSSCREVKAYRGAVFVCAPFCSTSCGNDAGARHDVYARFVVSGMRSPSSQDCFAQALLPTYRNLHNGAVPPCENVAMEKDARGIYRSYLAKRGEASFSKGVAGVSDQCASVIVTLFFGSFKNSLEQLIAAKCALVAQ